jgi:hypothetical protein
MSTDIWSKLLANQGMNDVVQTLRTARRLYYDGTSSRTKRRKNALNAKAHKTCPMAPLDSWLETVVAPLPSQPPSTAVLSATTPAVSVCRSEQQCFDMLNDLLVDKTTATPIFVQLVVLAKFFECRLAGSTRRDACAAAATLLPSAFHLGPRTVLNWCQAYQRFGCLPSSRRGRHQKTPSLIHDEDFLRKCGQWLRLTRPSLRTPQNFQFHLNETVLPELTGIALVKIYPFKYNYFIRCTEVNSVRSHSPSVDGPRRV